MKKLLVAVCCIAGLQSSMAQETEVINTYAIPETETTYRNGLYIGLGVAVMGDFKINENLQAVGMPQIGNTVPEITLGWTARDKNIIIDYELNTNYLQERTRTHTIRTVAAGLKVRGHYVAYETNKFFFSGGLDLTYMFNSFDLYTRGNVIDLDNLNPSEHTGHISLANEQFYVGPSIAIGAFQSSDYPLRLNVGYEWSLINGSWHSDVANVGNSFREDVMGRFYAKLLLTI